MLKLLPETWRCPLVAAHTFSLVAFFGKTSQPMSQRFNNKHVSVSEYNSKLQFQYIGNIMFNHHFFFGTLDGWEPWYRCRTEKIAMTLALRCSWTIVNHREPPAKRDWEGVVLDVADNIQLSAAVTWHSYHPQTNREIGKDALWIPWMLVLKLRCASSWFQLPEGESLGIIPFWWSFKHQTCSKHLEPSRKPDVTMINLKLVCLVSYFPFGPPCL